jgi:hypothetical protein
MCSFDGACPSGFVGTNYLGKEGPGRAKRTNRNDTLMEVSRDLETITNQERELILAHFDPEIAWQLERRLRDLAVSRHHAVAIEVRRFGQQLFYNALAGAAPDNGGMDSPQKQHRPTFLPQLVRHRARFTAEKQQLKRPLRPISVELCCGRRVLSADRGGGRSYWVVNRIWPA